MKTFTFPCSGGRVGLLQCPHPMTKEDFDTMIAIFHSWGPALTHPQFEAAALEASAFPEAQPVTLAQHIEQRGTQALADRKPSPDMLTGDGAEEAAAYSEGARYYEAGRVAFQNGIVRSDYPMPLSPTDPATIRLCDRWLEGWDAAQREAEGSADQ